MRSLTATVNQLLTSVNQLVSAHNVTPAEVTKPATSQVLVVLNQTATCCAVNVGLVPITFVIRMIGLGGVQVYETTQIIISAVTGTYTGQVLSDQIVRFEVTGASLVNLRANLVVHGNLPAGQIAESEAR